MKKTDKELLSEMSKETIEEAERLYPINNIGSMSMGSRNDLNNYYKQQAFIRGAKFRADRSFSEEDLREAFKQSRQAKIFEKDMPPVYESFEEWFSQFKKK